MSQIFLETRMFRLSEGEEIMTLAFLVLIHYRSVTDGRTDRRTGGRTDGHLCSGYTSACIACYANALVKILETNCTDNLLSIFALCSQKAIHLYSQGNMGKFGVNQRWGREKCRAGEHKKVQQS